MSKQCICGEILNLSHLFISCSHLLLKCLLLEHLLGIQQDSPLLRERKSRVEEEDFALKL